MGHSTVSLQVGSAHARIIFGTSGCASTLRSTRPLLLSSFCSRTADKFLSPLDKLKYVGAKQARMRFQCLPLLLSGTCDTCIPYSTVTLCRN